MYQIVATAFAALNATSYH